MGGIIPTIGAPPSPWSFDSALELSWHLLVCHLAWRLRTKTLLNLTCLPSWTHLILIGLCYVLGLSFFQKCPAPFPPVSCSSCEHRLGPQCCLYNLLEGQPENSWPFGGKYCIISNPSRYSGLHLLCFLQHVCQQYLLVNPLEWVTGTQCLLEVNLLVASLQGQLGFQGKSLPLWGLAQQAIWAQTLTTLILS